MTLATPDTAADLTPDWFSAALERTSAARRVTSVTLAPIGAGSGMMSALYRASLECADGSGPTSVIVKLPTANAQNKAVAVAFDNYRREVEFYRRAAGSTRMRTPRAYVAQSDAPDRFVLVLEDLCAWEQGDQVAGCGAERAAAVIDALADLHAGFWERVDDGALDWLPNSHPSVMSRGLAEGTEAAYDTFVDYFADVLDAPLRNAKFAYLAGLPNVQAWINAAPRTVIHGDFRMDNLFFRPAADRIEVACCDWQAPVRGKGVHDVAYFLSGSVATSVRREHEHALLQRWVDGLAARGVRGYRLEQAFEDYRRAILMLWTYVVVIGGGLAAETDRGESWIHAMVERSAASMVDHDCLALL